MTEKQSADYDAPWPVVMECHWPAPTLVEQGHTCNQCDGSHEHTWATWHDPIPSVLGHSCGPNDLPVRCRECGGRKCDRRDCRLRRHHAEEHEVF